MSAPPPVADDATVECSFEAGEGVSYDMAKSKREVETAVAPGMSGGGSNNVEAEVDPEHAKPASAPAPYANQKALKDDGSGPVTRRRCCLCCVILALIAGVICALYFTIGPEKAGEVVRGVAPTEPPTAAPTSQLFSDIMDLLLPYTPEETLLDSETPQGKALRQLMEEVEESGGEPVPHRILQRYALMTLYLSTSPGGWTTSTGWKTFGEDECEWYGIGTCRFLDDGTYGVANIELGNNGLFGPFPSEICAMAENLETIDVKGNALEGTIPSCLKDFAKLSFLNLRVNNFSGELPTGLLGISTMRILDFQKNQIEGSANNLFGNDTAATNLTSVRLNDNVLTGEFPEAVSSFAGLNTLALHNNDMTGEVPETVCEMQGLNTFLTTLTADCDEMACACCTCY